MKATMNPALRGFWATPSRYKVLHGGRASSKSWDAAANAIRIAAFCKVRILCVRQFQNKIEESVYSLLKIQIERFGMQDQFTVLNNKITHDETGSEFMFYGIQRNLDEIKSIESVDIMWLEEAHAVRSGQWEIIEPTIRKQGSEIWVVFNPSLITDFAYQRFVVNPPPDTIVRQINYPENPFLSDTMLSVIDAAKAEDYEEYEHIYLGVPRTDSDRAIIKRSWIEAARDAHIALGFEPSGMKRIGFDVGDTSDECANIFAHGSVALWGDKWKAKEDELLKSCSRTYANAKEYGASVDYDCIGVGASAGAKFKELNEGKHPSDHLEYRKFNAAGGIINPRDFYTEKVRNSDFFENLKAQAWWLVADRFRNTYNAVRKGESFSVDDLISISSDMPHIETLITELSTPRKDYSKNGKVKVESKADLAKREIKSPNLADAFIMAFAPIDSSNQAGLFIPSRLRR